MHRWQAFFVPAIVLSISCGSRPAASSGTQSLTAERATEVDQAVRTFARMVAHDVTQEGPAAWRRHFSDSPSFFMAVDGHLVFGTSAAATAGIQGAARAFKQIELQWGDELRVDPLAADLAVIATPYHEVRVDNAGKRVDENGFFTGVAEFRNGRWQFRNAHWSAAVPPPSSI